MNADLITRVKRVTDDQRDRLTKTDAVVSWWSPHFAAIGSLGHGPQETFLTALAFLSESGLRDAGCARIRSISADPRFGRDDLELRTAVRAVFEVDLESRTPLR